MSGFCNCYHDLTPGRLIPPVCLKCNKEIDISRLDANKEIYYEVEIYLSGGQVIKFNSYTEILIDEIQPIVNFKQLTGEGFIKKDAIVAIINRKKIIL